MRCPQFKTAACEEIHPTQRTHSLLAANVLALLLAGLCSGQSEGPVLDENVS